MAEERVQRRLAAIMAADVVGYSRLMGANEAATLASLKAHRKELVDAKIAEHQGRIVKLIGDGMLVEFTSVVNAVACAAEIQRKMRERNADVPEERRIEFRIGINLGDIIGDENDIYGDGVNVAARLEGIAEPGGICISREVACHVRDKQQDVWSTIKPEVDAFLATLPPEPPKKAESELAPDQNRPNLTYAGEKLKPEWSAKFIAGQVPYKPRPWIFARMPGFPARAELLAKGLAAQHGCTFTSPPPDKSDPELAAAGRKLAGRNGGFSCNQCHSKLAPSYDLKTDAYDQFKKAGGK